MTTRNPNTMERGLKALRRWYRALIALWFPWRFAHWVNLERCSIEIHNWPDGTWFVQLGTMPEQQGKTLSAAMHRAFMACEGDPEWKWTTDFLREL